jgi:hypothetical protein
MGCEFLKRVQFGGRFVTFLSRKIESDGMVHAGILQGLFVFVYSGEREGARLDHETRERTRKARKGRLAAMGWTPGVSPGLSSGRDGASGLRRELDPEGREKRGRMAMVGG